MRVDVLRSRLAEEQGATAVIVGICIVVLFGFGALAVDAGNLWANRRHVIVATDSASLAAAQEYALDGNGCALVPSYIEANHSGAELVSCTPSGSGSLSGTVTVVAKANVEHYFAQVLGFDADDVTSKTTAMWGHPASLKGLRPLGLCIEHPAVAAWLLAVASGADSYDPPEPIRYNNDFGACGTAPGNWGILDFDGGSNRDVDTRQWIEFGYDGSVEPGLISGDPGAFGGSLAGALEAIQNQDSVCLPIFASVEGEGSNAKFDVTTFVAVVIEDFDATGAQEDRYIDVKFVKDICEGDPLGSGGSPTGVLSIAICEVDHSTKVCT